MNAKPEQLTPEAFKLRQRQMNDVLISNYERVVDMQQNVIESQAAKIKELETKKAKK